MEELRSRMSINSSATVTLATATARSLLDSLSCDQHKREYPPPPTGGGVESAILPLATDFHDILGESMTMTTTIFP